MFRAIEQAYYRFVGRRFPTIDESTFLLWEPCTKSHAEVVPGYAKYLTDLGYRVVVFMSPIHKLEGLFCRWEHSGVQIVDMSQRQIRKFMGSTEVGKAAGLIVTTAAKLPENPDHSLNLHAIFRANFPKKLLLVEHDSRVRVNANRWSAHSITLRDLQGVPSVVVNPHFFGNIDLTCKNTVKTVFVMVGAARAKRRNQEMVFDALRCLLRLGYSQFELRLIGKKGVEPIPEDLRGCVRELGHVPFSKLYQEIEESDFIVTSFQKENPNHRFYRTSGTTGSYQLAYGFRKPCIVQQEFALNTALSTENSLIYDNDAQISDAFLTAITMNSEAYKVMQLAMQEAAEQLYEKSLRQLRALIDD